MSKMKMDYRKLRFSFLLGMVALIFSSCDSQVSAEVESGSEGGSHTIEISSSQFSGSKMELGKFQTMTYGDVIHANGKFDVPPENRADVSAYFGGYVKDINLLPGQKVKKGEVLFTMENPQYMEVQRDFLQSQSELKFLENDFQRQKSLLQDNATSEKVFLQAESNFKVAVVEFETLKRTLGLMNINWKNLTEKNIQTTISVLAPIGGYVTFVHANKGVYLNPSDVAINIVDPDHMHVELVIFEEDLPKVTEGQTILFRVPNDKSHIEEASIYLINKVIEEESRAIMIHGHLKDEEKKNRYSPGMYVEAEIVVELDTLTVLPSTAVVELEGKHYVLLNIGESEGNYTFEKREVKVGRFTENEWEILNPEIFPEDASFLVKGAYILIVNEADSGGISHSH